ncbi:MAG: DUF2804 family protein [Solirubrobacterales bacterium]
MSAGEQDSVAGRLPWRGPGPGRPALPLPPERMPLRSHGALRKRWRYVGVFCEELMLCAARASVGPLGHCFWAVLDRRSGRALDHTRRGRLGGEVVFDGPRLEIGASTARAELVLADSEPVEAVCASGAGWGWTRKRAGMRVSGTVEAAGRRWELDALGVDDVSAGYHARHTSWRWSAGVGRATDGRSVAWNLVSGINDPPVRSERAIWVEGQAAEPAPVSFEGLDAVVFEGGERAGFATEMELSRDDNLLLVRSRYRHRFGSFTGHMGGIELDGGLGVMEEHEALW